MTSDVNGNGLKARKLLLGLALATFSAASLSACNTVEGAGEDIEATGEAIQDSADGDN